MKVMKAIKKMKNKTVLVMLVMISVVVAGCSTRLPEPQTNMQDLLLAHTGHQQVLPQPSRPIGYNDSEPHNLSDYTRSVRTETENLFTRLPNPDLFLYIPPHVVSREGIPVPGYSITFKLYARDHLALPGEVRR